MLPKLILSIFSSLLVVNPAVAHIVKTDGNVGATFHIEPNHNPRAGESNQAWFALTREGGELISYSSCDCELVVKSESDHEPILPVPLTGISVEQYEGIPGADIIFPKEGIYELILKGSPKSGADFQPFQLSYNVTVTPGVASEANEGEVSPENSRFWWAISAIASGTILGIVIFFRRRRNQIDEG